jgi:hypothetical protein
VTDEQKEWHVPDLWLARFAEQPGSVDGVNAASIEQHLAACGQCQAQLARRFPADELAAVWGEVADRIDRRADGFAGWWSDRLGFSTASVRLLAATPALRASALVALIALVAVVAWTSRRADAAGLFLLLAPVAPVALVAASFTPGADPAGEAGLATPMYGFALIVRRALALELVAVSVLALGSLLVPLDGWRSIAWVLPSLALSLGTMAGSVRWRPITVAAVVLTAWGAAATASTWRTAGHRLADSPLFDVSGQVGLVALALGAILVITAHRDVLYQEVRS